MFIWSTLEQFKRHHQSCYSGYGGWHVHDATESITFLDVPKMTALCSFSTSHLMSVRITFVILQSAHAQEDKVWGQKWSASSEQSSYVTYKRSHLSSMLSRNLPEILIPSREELYTGNGYSSITNEPTYRRGCLLPFQVAPHRFSSTEKVFTSQSDKEDPTLLKRMRVPLLCESCRATFSLRRSRPYDPTSRQPSVLLPFGSKRWTFAWPSPFCLLPRGLLSPFPQGGYSPCSSFSVS